MTALAYLESAMAYPSNLGIGRPARPADAKIYWLAAVAAEKVGAKEKETSYLQMAADEGGRPDSRSERVREAARYGALARERLAYSRQATPMSG